MSNRSITCPRCGYTSHNPNDVEAGYCGKCHWWTSDPILGRAEIVAQAEADEAIQAIHPSRQRPVITPGVDSDVVAQGIERAEADIANPPDSCWYISFVDPDRPEGDRWLGACIVRCSTMLAALPVAWMRGCNPGGQAAMRGPFDVAKIKPEYLERLLTSRSEVEEATV